MEATTPARPQYVGSQCDPQPRHDPPRYDGRPANRSEASDLADLQMNWDKYYVIGLDGDIWSARYKGSIDDLRAHNAHELRELIRADYAFRQHGERMSL